MSASYTTIQDWEEIRAAEQERWMMQAMEELERTIAEQEQEEASIDSEEDAEARPEALPDERPEDYPFTEQLVGQIEVDLPDGGGSYADIFVCRDYSGERRLIVRGERSGNGSTWVLVEKLHARLADSLRAIRAADGRGDDGDLRVHEFCDFTPSVFPWILELSWGYVLQLYDSGALGGGSVRIVIE
jgi:hypothetical protein